MPILDSLSHSDFHGGSFTDKSFIVDNRYSVQQNLNYQLPTYSIPLREIHASVSPGSTHDSFNRRPFKGLRDGNRSMYTSPSAYIRRLEINVEQLEVDVLFKMEQLYQRGGADFKLKLATYLEESGKLVASYFVDAKNKLEEEKDIRQKFFPTIASQLAVHFPQLVPQLEDILRQDPTILTKSIETQCKKLIIEPFKRLLDFKEAPKYIVIDGLLDHCNIEDAIEVLNVLGHALKQLPVPIHVLVFSNSAENIQKAMEDPFLKSVTRTILSSRAYHPWDDDGSDDESRMDVCED